MKFCDEKLPQDTIEATVRPEAYGDLVEIEMQGDRAECIYLSKKNAKAFGEYLVLLSERI